MAVVSVGRIETGFVLLVLVVAIAFHLSAINTTLTIHFNYKDIRKLSMPLLDKGSQCDIIRF